jgi:hypothetical protein
MVFNNNYGGLMQAYGLQTYLKERGHDVFLINAQRKPPCPLKAPFTVLKRVFLRFVRGRKIDRIVPEWAFPGRIGRREKNTRAFVNQYINPKTRVAYSNGEIGRVGQGFDCYIVGSDQVWRPTMYPFIESAFLGFVKGKGARRFSYAASFGVNEWLYTSEQTRIFKKDIAKFSQVSVREASGVKLCKKHFDVNAVQVLDPTLLLNRSHYQKLIPKEEIERINPGLLCYILDDSTEKEEMAGIIANSLNLKEYNFFDGKNSSGFQYPTVTSWLAAFCNSKFVFTDSFHGCVFSILFNKPFIVFGNRVRGLDRFISLLETLGLMDRLVHSMDSFNNLDLQKEIDWRLVNEILDRQVKFSRRFLETSIHG